MKKLTLILVILFAIMLCACNADSSVVTTTGTSNYTTESQVSTILYDINDDYFEFNYFDFTKSTTIGVGSYYQSVDYTLNIYGQCYYDLTEVTVTVLMYSSSNELLDTLFLTLDEPMSADTEFCVSVEIDSDIYNQLSYMQTSYSGKSETSPNTSSLKYIVTFVNNNQSSNTSIVVEYGNAVSTPTSPTKENYIFSMWCTDISLTTAYDFSLKITSNTTLYAKYIVDYAALTNTITADIMKCNVTVYAKSYNTFLGITTSSSSSLGSGIIFYASSNYYYILTNNHVVVQEDGYDKVSYTIEDYKGNTYTGYAKHMEASYDLAVLYFKIGDEDLGVIELGSENAAVSEEIAAVGQPMGQTNALSFGTITGYVSAPTLATTEAYRSDVSFDVLKHSASTASGSSGCAILNVDLQLVGIHYASSFDSNGNSVCGYAIPIEKINEFLNLYVWGT